MVSYLKEAKAETVKIKSGLTKNIELHQKKLKALIEKNKKSALTTADKLKKATVILDKAKDATATKKAKVIVNGLNADAAQLVSAQAVLKAKDEYLKAVAKASRSALQVKAPVKKAVLAKKKASPTKKKTATTKKPVSTISKKKVVKKSSPKKKAWIKKATPSKK